MSILIPSRRSECVFWVAQSEFDGTLCVTSLHFWSTTSQTNLTLSEFTVLTIRIRLVLLAVLALFTPPVAMAANAIAGTSTHGQTIAAPPGTSVSDWNILVVPRAMGFYEIGSEGDNALLRFEVSAAPLSTVGWSVWARFKYRNSSGPGTWYSGSVDYLLVRKELSVGGTLSHGQNLAVPSGTSVSDWNIVVSPASAGMEEVGAEFDNSLLRFSTSYTIIDNSTWQAQATYKFRYSNQGLSAVYSSQAHYLLVSRDVSVIGPVSSNQTFATQGNTAVSDWSALVIPTGVGYEEPGSEGDNAILCFENYFQVADTYLWRAPGRYKYRGHNGDGTWFGAALNYVIVRN
ncbi:hypothetical protein OWM54_34770 [Myxococcus sp. MISCRS1]|uniref:hypothetical protein n=1 Tax=Myxococcus sp. MISCRS1 TaxID=2996786 RepID=UPI00226F161E|nr:hypothetical protein [Myxococcus sp. MISCRS1]MCY1002330.1 hypothetical protein [Myxococcus sp. MISCRS1]